MKHWLLVILFFMISVSGCGQIMEQPLKDIVDAMDEAVARQIQEELEASGNITVPPEGSVTTNIPEDILQKFL